MYSHVLHNAIGQVTKTIPNIQVGFFFTKLGLKDLISDFVLQIPNTKLCQLSLIGDLIFDVKTSNLGYFPI